MRSLSERGVDIPKNHAEMIEKCRVFRRSEFNRISTLTFQELQDWVRETMAIVSKLLHANDCYQLAWACYIIDLLRKLCPDQRLIEMTNRINADRNVEVAIFVAYVSSKLHKKVEMSVVQEALTLHEQKIKDMKDPIASAHFLHFMAQYSKNSVLLNANFFMKICLQALFVKNSIVRITAGMAVQRFLKILRDTSSMARHFGLCLYNEASEQILSKDPVMIHGSLLIYSALLEVECYDLISDVELLYVSLLRVLRLKYPDIHSQALYCAVLARPLNIDLYQEKCYSDVCKYLLEDNAPKTITAATAKAFLAMNKHCPGFLSTFRDTIAVMKAMLYAGLPHGFDLLLMIAQEHEELFQENLDSIISTLSSVSITDGYAACVPELFAIYPSLWKDFHAVLLERVLLILKKSPTVAVLKLIASCPELRDERLTATLLDLLDCKDSGIRSCVPDALLRHSNYLSSHQMREVVNTLMTQALSDAIHEVRAAILRALTKAFHGYLSSSAALENLGALANDDSYDVREAVMLLLMDMNKIKPFSVQPFLRRILLNNLFLLSSPGSHRLRSEMTRLLLIMLGPSDLLPLVAPVVCEITLGHLNSPLKRDVTIFERKSFYQISTNLTKAIDLLTNIDIGLIGHSFSDLMDVFMKVLQQHNQKQLKFAVVQALTTLVSKGQTQFPIDRKGLFEKISSIASKWNSRKLNVALLKLMGVLGAVDLEQNVSFFVTDVDEISTNHRHFYLKVTCKALMQILKDESLNASHLAATQVLIAIFRERDEVSSDAFSEFMPMFISEIRTTKNRQMLALLRQLCMVAPAKWMTRFSDELIALIHELWGSEALNDVLSVIPALASVLLDRFAPFLPQSISLLLDCLFSNRSVHSQICHEVLISIMALRWISNDYLFLIIPELVGSAMYPTTLPVVRCDILQTLRVLVQSCDLSTFAAQIVRCVGFCLSINDTNIRQQALQVLYSIQVALGPSFAVYQEMVREFMTTLNIPMQTYREIESANPPLSYEMFEVIHTDDPSIEVLTECRNREVAETFDIAPLSQLIEFRQEESHCTRKEWFKNLVFAVIANSPINCIAEASTLAKVNAQLADMLFNAAFLSCWEIECPKGEETIVAALTSALESKYLTSTARCAIVELIEFMDRAEAPVKISPELLYYSCRDTANHAKAFYFANRWYRETGSKESKDAMITMASSMGLEQTVKGLAKVFANGPMPPAWCEQLGDWSTALDGYSGDSPADVTGKLRCLCKLMQWEKVLEYAPLAFSMPEIRNEIAASMIKANFYRQDVEALVPWLEYAEKDDPNTCIIAAMVKDRLGDHEGALAQIESTFDVLARRAQSVFKHDKSSLYPTILDAMRLTELKESIEGCDSPQVWSERLKFVRKSFGTYFLILSVRFRYHRTDEQAIQLLKRAMKAHKSEVYRAVLARLFPDGNYSNQVKCINAEEKWERGLHKEALQDIMEIDSTGEHPKLASHISFLRGHWTIRSTAHSEVTEGIRSSLPHLVRATELDPQNYKAWHRWAWASATLFFGDKTQLDSAVNSIKGFVECVKLRSDNCFSDLIQMISLFFTADLDRDCFENASRCVSSLGDSFLLKVAPQLFAQLNANRGEVTRFVTNLIKGLLPQHFHALLYPLLLLKNDDSGNDRGSAIAADLLTRFENINPDAVHQAEIVQRGLLKCSTSSLEKWVEVLAKLSQFCAKRDFKSMQTIINASMEKEPKTLEAASFYDTYNKNIEGILASLQQLQLFYSQKAFTSMVSNLKEFSELLRQELHEFKLLKLAAFAPELDQLKDSVLAVPGTYSNECDLVTISYFNHVLEVISSKQHPRLVGIMGSDGKQHTSLLKGSEDLRLDQHVMQFFELVNMHIKNGFSRNLRSLRVHIYSITPLSKMSGLIQFLDHTETLYKMISGYRLKRDIKLDSEIIEGKKHSVQDIDILRPIQRMEVLREISENTPDTHLREVIWLRSANSGAWIGRTLRFAQTTAISSIVGYILGLGDRHPSNIMMHKLSGDVIHIDFGDCFEVGQHRIQFPEAVPFRLTRMIRAAFGPAGNEGEFRTTCEAMMKLIRSHRESIMTVLDIFMQVPVEGTEGQEMRVRSQPDNSAVTKVKGSLSMFSPARQSPSNETVRLNIRSALNRIADKITGHDFENDTPLSPHEQVTRLIDDAQNGYNLACMYHGWMPMW